MKTLKKGVAPLSVIEKSCRQCASLSTLREVKNQSCYLFSVTGLNLFFRGFNVWLTFLARISFSSQTSDDERLSLN